MRLILTTWIPRTVFWAGMSLIPSFPPSDEKQCRTLGEIKVYPQCQATHSLIVYQLLACPMQGCGRVLAWTALLLHLPSVKDSRKRLGLLSPRHRLQKVKHYWGREGNSRSKQAESRFQLLKRTEISYLGQKDIEDAVIHIYALQKQNQNI